MSLLNINKLNKKQLIWLVIFVWVLVTAIAFWWYEFRLLRPFSESVVFFEAEALPVPIEFGGKKSIKVLHFYKRGCYCNSVTQTHLKALFMVYETKSVEFYTIGDDPIKDNKWLVDSFARVSIQRNKRLYELIPSSPGVAIWDVNDRLAYFGPYSTGPTCNSNNGFVEVVLDDLIQGGHTTVTSTVGSGCFCDWRNDKT